MRISASFFITIQGQHYTHCEVVTGIVCTVIICVYGVAVFAIMGTIEYIIDPATMLIAHLETAIGIGQRSIHVGVI